MKNKTPKILMVEDDADLCASWMDLFMLIGYDMVCHQRGLDALEDRAALESCDVIISDFYLPDINGVELISRVRKVNPELQAILLTGSRDAVVLDSAAKLTACTILHKPINIEDIENKLKKLFAN